jgi:tetratricopeptide (TPR) repeat protein
MESAGCLLALGDIYRTRKPLEAVEMFKEAIEVCAECRPHSEELFRCHFKLGDVYFSLQLYSEALEEYSKWLVCKERFSGTLEVRYYTSVARTLVEMSEAIKAKYHYHEARKILTLLEPSVDLAQCHYALGQLYHRQLDKSQKAREQYTQAKILFAKLAPNSQEYANCLLHFAQLYEETKQPKLAKELYQQACAILSSDFPNSLSHAKCLHCFGTFYRSQKKTQEAVNCLVKCHTIYDRNPFNSLEYATSLSSLGKLYRDTGALDEAQVTWLRAVSLLEEGNLESNELAECWKELGLLYKKRKLKAQAKLSFEAAVKIYKARGEFEGEEAKVCEKELNRLLR